MTEQNNIELNDKLTEIVHQLKLLMHDSVMASSECQDGQEMREYYTQCLVPIINGLCIHLSMLMKITNNGWDQERFSSLGQLMKDLITMQLSETDAQMYMQHCQFCPQQDDCEISAKDSWEGKTCQKQ